MVHFLEVEIWNIGEEKERQQFTHNSHLIFFYMNI